MTERITPSEFHRIEGVEDWRVLSDGAAVCFSTGSIAAGSRLLSAISELDDLRADIDLRYDAVTVRLNTTADGYVGLTSRDAELASRISATARGQDVVADSSAVHSIQLTFDALDIAAVLPFWRDVLGYEEQRDAPCSLIDPHARGTAVRFQQLDSPRPLRNRIHLDLATTYDIADGRRAAALASGGHVVNRERPWVLADPEGNEVCAGGANADVVPRPPDVREGWDSTMADGASGLVAVGWRQFHETDAVADWRMLDMGAATYFRTGSFVAGARLVDAICGLDGLSRHRPDIDVRRDGVTVRLITLTDSFGGPASQHDVALAQEISAVAHKLDVAADPTGVQTVLISIDALDIPAVMPFWTAVLGYEKRADTDEDLLDPQGRWAPFWFQQMDGPRARRNRIHVDVSVPHDHAPVRIAMALAAGGRLVTEEPARSVLADSEGNEVCVTSCR